jgi:hypothetical protein
VITPEIDGLTIGLVMHEVENGDDLLQSLGGVTAISTSEVERNLWEKARSCRYCFLNFGSSLHCPLSVAVLPYELSI